MRVISLVSAAMVWFAAGNIFQIALRDGISAGQVVISALLVVASVMLTWKALCS